jgi:hypothetical protein
VTIKGALTDYWRNPHILLLLDAKDESGNTVHWIIESQAPSNMTNYGWSRASFKAGELRSILKLARFIPAIRNPTSSLH